MLDKLEDNQDEFESVQDNARIIMSNIVNTQD